MKAVRVEAFGGVEVLRLVERDAPKPRAGEVLVKVMASGLNYADLMQREGLYLGGPKPPYFPGMEAAGVVERVGPPRVDESAATGGRSSEGSTDEASLKVGARVACITRGGAQAEYVVADAEACVPLPEAMSFAEGAAFPVQYLTAYHALTTVAHAAEGETVLIHAAGGGVGTAAVQLARLLGLRVIATTSTREKRARVVELGAHRAAGYEEFEEAAREFTRGRGPDIILETAGGDVMRRGLKLLPPLGRLVLVGLASKEAPPLDALRLLFRSQSVMGLHLDSIVARRDLMRASLARLLGWLAEGALKIQVGHTLPLSEIRAAHELLAGRASYGKIVLLP